MLYTLIGCIIGANLYHYIKWYIMVLYYTKFSKRGYYATVKCDTLLSLATAVHELNKDGYTVVASDDKIPFTDRYRVILFKPH